MDPFQSFFATCPEMLFVAGKDGAILHANEALLRAFGPIAERTPIVDIAHPADRSAVEASLERLRAGQPRAEILCRWRGADGADLTCSCGLWTSPERDEVHGSLRSVVEPAAPGPRSPMAPGAPAEPGHEVPGVSMAALLRAILDNFPIVAWVLDREGRYLFSDGKGLEAIGLTPGQVVGKSMAEFSPKALDPGTPVARTLAGETLQDVSQHVGCWWQNWFIPLRDERGDVTAVAGLSLDVTEAKRGEQELLEKITQIERQQQVIQEIGTPIIEVWDGVLALPMFGLLDTRRAAGMMDSLLEAVSGRQARYAILDLTGVGMVDSATASHLVSLARAVQLLGAEGVITGIRPSVAQTMVTLGLDLGEIVTLADLRDGIRYCIARSRARDAGPTPRTRSPR